MSFEDFAARMKARRDTTEESPGEKTYDFEESYRIRAKMLGVLLRDARQSAARTIEDCARLLNVSSDLIENWEYGEQVPALPQLELLAYYLDVPISHFWGMETRKVRRDTQGQKQPEYIQLRNRMVAGLLRQAREEAGLSIEGLSATSGIEVSHIQAYETGDQSVPVHELSVLASGVNKNLNYFEESSGQIGELLAMREAWQHFADLPEDIREFAANPVNIGFIHIAVMLSKMPSDQLREVGASILDITM